ncbi:IPT/TIG domain-containing protein [Thermopolyspora sp. NPDC052614]|uniref:IPT/TIG domain-containing protein n=1 Tax=Thermopolyspora sp. NPDC052614 TaxID=3155682 RepID=UPI003449526B
MTHVQTIQLKELRPNSGPSEGDDQVELIGSGLATTEQVWFGSEPAEFEEEGDTRLTIWTPPGSGEVDVYVIDQDGNRSNSLRYSYFD